MTREQAIQHQIDEIMDEFDFRKVADYMKGTDWKWHNAEDGVPSEQEIRKSVRSTMIEMANRDEFCYYSGGMLIRLVENKLGKWLRFSVQFVIEGCDNDGTEYITED